MGCQSSKSAAVHSDFAEVDDSIHVILSSARNGKPHYVPQQPHPLLLAAASKTAPTVVESEDDMDDVDSLLFHTTHHNDTIDPRDLAEYGSKQLAVESS